MNIGGRWLS